MVDPLSDVLRVIRLSGGVFLRLQLGAPFGFTTLDAEKLRRMLAPTSEQLIPFHLVARGSVWLHVEGSPPVLLERDDLSVLPHGTGHGFSSSQEADLTTVPDMMSHATGSPPTISLPGTGRSQVEIICGFLACRCRLYGPLLDALPVAIAIRHGTEGSPWLAATLKRAFDEAADRRPGSAALLEGLTSLLFTEVLQRQLSGRPSGWLDALSDPVVGEALQAIHEKPSEAWTVSTLSKRAGTSRSVLAERFVKAVGISPIKYLTAWRIELGTARLLDSSDSIAEIALYTGYESEASFSRAFRRHVGSPPGTWRASKQVSEV